jgi:hypothetical protein
MQISRQFYLWTICLLPFVGDAQNILWQRTYNQVGTNHLAVKTVDGNIICSGIDNASSPNFPYSFTYKVSPTGQTLWSQLDSFFCEKVAATPDSGFVASGYRIYPNLNSISFIRKVDKNGQIQWQKKQTLTIPNTIIYEIIPTSDAAYMTYGSRNDSLFLEKLDRAGNRIWFKIWKDLNQNRGGQIIEIASGGFMLNNALYFTQDTGSVMKTDALGNIQWRRTTLSNELGIANMVLQGATTTYLSHRTHCIYQLDSLGNPLGIPNCYDGANRGGYYFLKRRLGGYWLAYYTEDTARNLHLTQLDANGAMLTHKVLENQPYLIHHISEASDTTLLLAGFRAQAGNWIKTFLMEVHPTARTRPNLIIGSLSGRCGGTFQNWVVGATNSHGATYFGRVNAQNRYEIETDTGTFLIQAYPNSQHWQSSVATLTQFGTGQIDSIPLVINCLENCPDLKVAISTPLLRRCFSNDYFVNYCNNGTISATGAYVEVKLDSLLQYLSGWAIVAFQSWDG